MKGFYQDFDVLNKWLENNPQGEYTVTIEKKDGKIQVVDE